MNRSFIDVKKITVKVHINELHFVIFILPRNIAITAYYFSTVILRNWFEAETSRD